MKNPFLKEDNTKLLIVAAFTSALAAGAGIWFYLSAKRAAEAKAQQFEHNNDYLSKKGKKKKKHKTDVSELGDLVQHPQI